MPYSRNSDAKKKTRKANIPKKQRQWRHIVNGALKRGYSEGVAIRMGNGVIARGGKKRAKGRAKWR